MKLLILLTWPFSRHSRYCWTTLRLLRQSNGDHGQFLGLVGHYGACEGERGRRYVEWVQRNILREFDPDLLDS